MDATRGTAQRRIGVFVGLSLLLGLGAVIRIANGRSGTIDAPLDVPLDEQRERVLRVPTAAFAGGLRRASWDLEQGVEPRAPAPLASPSDGLDTGTIGR